MPKWYYTHILTNLDILDTLIMITQLVIGLRQKHPE